MEKEKGEQCPGLVRTEISNWGVLTSRHPLSNGYRDQSPRSRYQEGYVPPLPEPCVREGFPASSCLFLVSLGVLGLWKHLSLFLFPQDVDESVIGP